MEPTIQTCAEKKLIGQRLSMSLSDNQVGALWGGFMPKRRQITNVLSPETISMAIYPPSYFTRFDPTKSFEKWAAVEVINFDQVPEGMEPFLLPSGLYAVFHYKGLSTDRGIFDHIFRTWIPASRYSLDERPHFEVLGSKYKNNDPSSEEDIWIPIKAKAAGN